MDAITLQIGSVVAMNGGQVVDKRRDVEFTGEELGSVREYGTGRDGSLTDTRGTTETLYRTEDGRLVVHVKDWSRWQGEPTTEHLQAVDESDLRPGGRFEALGHACGFGRALTLEEAIGEREPDDVLDVPARLRAWPESAREALAFWLSHACDTVGLADKRQRLALQRELAVLMGEIPEDDES